MPAKSKYKCSICGKPARSQWLKSNKAGKYIQTKPPWWLCFPCRKKVDAKAKEMHDPHNPPYLRVLAAYKEKKAKLAAQKNKCSICGAPKAMHSWLVSISKDKVLCSPCYKSVTRKAAARKDYSSTPYLQVLKEHHKVKPGPIGDRRRPRRDAEDKCPDCEEKVCSTCSECHDCDYIVECEGCGMHVSEDNGYYCDSCECGSCTGCSSWCSNCDTCTGCCSPCGDCENCESECTCHVESDVASDEWDLPLDFDLPGVAAAFYLRADMAAEDDLYRDRFLAYAKEIAPIFARYLDMAIGGELRYGAGECPDSDSLMPDVVKKYGMSHHSISRGKAWSEWKELREEMGVVALEQAEECLLHGNWHGGMGGKRWGSAAHLLLLYETKQIDYITFVDSAFGLEHNNGCIFNKRWTGGSKLRSVLDANLRRDQGPEIDDSVTLRRADKPSRLVQKVLPNGTFTTYKDYKMPSETLRVSDIYWGMDILLKHAPEEERRRYEAWRRYSHRRLR